PDPRRADREAARARDPRHQPARRPDRRPRHHPVSRRSDAARGRTAAAHPEDRDPLLDRRQEDPARRRRAVHGAHDSGGARCADRCRPAEGDSARRARRPRSPRAADQGRLRRQERADVADPERAGAPDRGGRPRRSGDHRVMKKDLLGIGDLTEDEIHLVLDTAEAMREIAQRPIKKVPTLRGKTVVNLFYEPSTRTLTSFEIAEKLHSAVLRSNVLLLTRLGAEVWVSGPPTLVPVGLERHGVHVSSSIDEAVADADVVMMLRIQQERMHGAFFPSLREYFFTFGMTK